MALPEKGKLSRREFLTRTATGLGAVAAATMLPGGEAEAQQSATRAIRFGQHDVRGESEAGILTAAAHSSVNSVSLLVRTPNQQTWPVAYQTALRLAQEGYPVSLVLAADGPNRLEIYAKGIGEPFGVINNPSGSRRTADLIRSEMIRVHNLAFGPLQIGSSDPTAIPPGG